MFEDNVCVDLLGVLDRRPNNANITFSELFVGPCIDRPEVMDKGPDYATALILEFCVRARCPPVLTPPSRGAAVKVYGWEKESLQEKRFRFFFFFHFFFFVYG